MKFMAMAVAVLFVMVSAGPIAAADADGGVEVLIDHGNGVTEWTDANGASVDAVLREAAEKVGSEYSSEGGTVTLDGLTERTVGSSDTGGTYSVPGTTGVTVKSSWKVFGWDGSSWKRVTNLSDACEWSAIALGFYPDGTVPVVTPSDPFAKVMFRNDALNSGSSVATEREQADMTVKWTDKGAAHANALYAGGFIYQKFGIDSAGKASLVCIDAETGDTAWTFEFLSGANYESSAPVIVGNYIYMATLTGYIYKIPLTGPGEGNQFVTSYAGCPMADAKPVPSVIKEFDEGTTYDSAYSSLIYDSGVLITAHSNGMVYCYDLDLNLVWSYMMGASSYFIPPTVTDGLVFTSALNGHMYILDQQTGGEDVDQVVYQISNLGKLYGGLGQISVLPGEDEGEYVLFFTVTDGLGMSQKRSGIAVYHFDRESNTLAKTFMNDSGGYGRYVTPVQNDEFSGAYFVVSDGLKSALCRIDASGNIERLTEGVKEIHAPLSFVNGKYLYAPSYSPSDPIYKFALDGEIAGVMKCPGAVANFNMVPLLIVGDVVFGGTDSGIYCVDGSFEAYVVPEAEKNVPVIFILAAVLAAIMAVLVVIYAVMRFVRHIEKPFSHIKDRFKHYLYGDDYTHNTKNRHRLKFVLAVGVILAVIAFTMCICIGSASVQNPIEAYSAMFSAISKGGVGLDTVETDIFASRLPRAIAAFAVGIGLSVAGCIYQAIIRNPLVDPYIMGVSSGAGVAAIAVIAFDFTFFGLFSPHSIYLTAITAIIGGLIAFGCTMLLAEKSGGQAVNYVLSGVVVGLAFSAIQTIMLTMAGNKLNNALAWLYGSFAQVTWSQVGVVVFLSLFLSLVPLIWAKEFNLVLLGEDQARQMGLDVKWFNRCMLILASVLTSVCVAFVGVIGFVGLVIPHLCRMLLGSDHRMVLPASICFGGVMLMLADLLARTGYLGMELPVGAITTVIGIPVFAYLLIKKGRMYSG